MEIKGGLPRIIAWAREDPEHAAKVAVLPPIIAVTFAVAASHTLEVGAIRAHVTGWKAWSVAGTLEILAAYAFFRAARASGWRRVFPALVSAVCAVVILWINLASIADYSLAAIKRDPFPALFAVTPAVAFLLAAALIEVDGWKRPQRRRAARGATKNEPGDRMGAKAQTKPETGAEGSPPWGTPEGKPKPLVDEMTLHRARQAIERLEANGMKITGDTLRVEMGSRKDTALKAMDVLGYGRKRESA